MAENKCFQEEWIIETRFPAERASAVGVPFEIAWHAEGEKYRLHNFGREIYR
jgi:hypothetical protein